MRKVDFALTIFLILILFAVQVGSACAAPPSQKARWTVMVYISGDNDLESYVIGDIETELAAVGSTRDVQVVALADRGPGASTGPADWKTTEFFHVTQNMKATLAYADADWDAAHEDELDMGDQQTLIDFVNWTKTHYPAEHYALIFWGHGWNWHPDYVMRDDTTALTTPEDATLDYEEQEAALPSLGFIDVVGYDGCNMSSIEILNLWHGHATAVTSSQEYVYWEGLQYDWVLEQMAAHLKANPTLTADQVAVFFSQSATEDRTWSAVAVDDRFDALLSAVDDWSLALKNGLGVNRKKYDQAFTATRSFWQAPEDKDLYDMAYEIHRLVGDANIKSTSQAVMDAIDAVVLHERHVNSYADAHGITIYHISRATQKDSDYLYYQELDFAQQTGWDEFLEAYVR